MPRPNSRAAYSCQWPDIARLDWALLEEAKFTEESKWISSADREELKAWKHVRNTGAHALGGRAGGRKAAFDAFMNSPEPGVSGLKQNCSFTEESIELADGINWKFFEFIRHRSGPCFELASEAPLAPRECWQKAAKTDAKVR